MSNTDHFNRFFNATNDKSGPNSPNPQKIEDVHGNVLSNAQLDYANGQGYCDGKDPLTWTKGFDTPERRKITADVRRYLGM